MNSAPGAARPPPRAISVTAGTVRSANAIPPARSSPGRSRRASTGDPLVHQPALDASLADRAVDDVRALDRVAQVAGGAMVEPRAELGVDAAQHPADAIEPVAVGVVQHDVVEPGRDRLGQQGAVDRRCAEPSRADQGKFHGSVVPNVPAGVEPDPARVRYPRTHEHRPRRRHPVLPRPHVRGPREPAGAGRGALRQRPSPLAGRRRDHGRRARPGSACQPCWPRRSATMSPASW